MQSVNCCLSKYCLSKYCLRQYVYFIIGRFMLSFYSRHCKKVKKKVDAGILTVIY